jgi:hypothetical protein
MGTSKACQAKERGAQVVHGHPFALPAEDHVVDIEAEIEAEAGKGQGQGEATDLIHAVVPVQEIAEDADAVLPGQGHDIQDVTLEGRDQGPGDDQADQGKGKDHPAALEAGPPLPNAQQKNKRELRKSNSKRKGSIYLAQSIMQHRKRPKKTMKLHSKGHVVGEAVPIA